MPIRCTIVACLALMLAACSQPGCGFGTTDAALMTKIKQEMKRQGIAFEEHPDGMVYCSSADAERFHALVASAEAEYMRQVPEDRVGRVAILVDSPDHASCLSAELARRQIPFNVGTLAGKQSVEWKPESDAQKMSVLSACARKEQ
jgi:hypothetical protein